MLPGEQHLGAVAGQKLLVYQESDHPAAEHLVDMVREGYAEGDLPSRSDFRRELEVSPRTLARDLDFLRDEERAQIEYDARAHGVARHSLGLGTPVHPSRFARPEIMNQIAMVNQSGKTSAERVIVLPEGEFDALVGRPGYHQRDNGDLERREGSLVYLIVRQQSNQALPMGEEAYG